MTTQLYAIEPPRRRVRLVAAVILCWLVHGAIAADWKPNKNVELIVSTAPGSGPDLTARAMQKIWQAAKTVVATVSVVNKPGGNFAASWTYLEQHAGDAHYLAMASPGLLIGNGSGALPYAEATVIAQLYSEHMVIAVRADSKIDSSREMIRRLRENPANPGFAVGGSAIGGVNHLALATIMKAAGIPVKKLKVVAFGSAQEAAVAVLGGHVEAMISTAAAALLQARSGKLRILAVSAPRRLGRELSEVPTWREQGVDATFDNFRVVLGPRGMAADAVRYWENALGALAQSTEWKDELNTNYWTAAYLDSMDTRKSLVQRVEELKAMHSELGAGDR
jgi:putative tricarboxylic transport membrane protein